jgi:hypothetical protein
MKSTRRNRLRLALLAAVALLFQQTALAAYVCSSADMPPRAAAMAAHCEGMPMVQAEQSPALCSAHCSQQPVTTPALHAPVVPPLLMPALLPASSLTLGPLSAASAQSARAAAWRLSGIPPALQFRILLI